MFLRTLIQQRGSAFKCYNHYSQITRVSGVQPVIPLIRTSSIRWQSTEPQPEVEAAEKERIKPINTNNGNTKEEDDRDDKEPKETQEIPGKHEDEKAKVLEAVKQENIDIKDKYLRIAAEFRNLQARNKREVQAAKDFAIQRFAKDLIDSVDNLDRALSMVPPEKLNASDLNDDNKDLISLYEGLKMTESVLMSTLAKHGLERFDPSLESEKFNPNEHEATFMKPVEGKENDTVFKTQQKGYKLNGRVLRAAKVGVVKNA